MGPYVTRVRPLASYELEVEFDNGEVRVFAIEPYLHCGVFARLRDANVFESARVVAGSVEWPGEVDLSYDTLYLEGRPVSSVGVGSASASQE